MLLNGDTQLQNREAQLSNRVQKHILLFEVEICASSGAMKGQITVPC